MIRVPRESCSARMPDISIMQCASAASRSMSVIWGFSPQWYSKAGYNTGLAHYKQKMERFPALFSSTCMMPASRRYNEQLNLQEVSILTSCERHGLVMEKRGGWTSINIRPESQGNAASLHASVPPWDVWVGSKYTTQEG